MRTAGWGSGHAKTQGKGVPMFFLLRAAFWLSLAVLLLPSGEDGQPQTAQVSTGEAIYAAQTFVADISGFCERNPDTCQTGEQALKTFGSKARYGAKLVYGYLGDFTGEDADIPHRTVATTRVQVQPAEGEQPTSVTYYPPVSNNYSGPAPSAVATHTGSISIGSLIRDN